MEAEIAREELYNLWQRHGASFESDSSEGWELADAILASNWLAAHDAKVWDEAVRALSWAIDNGPDPLRYVRDNNPYRHAPAGVWDVEQAKETP